MVPFAGSVVERGAEFILPENTAVESLAARFHLPLVRKGTPYGRREARGAEAVPKAALDATFDRIASGEAAPTGETVLEAIEGLGLEPRMAALIRARSPLTLTMRRAQKRGNGGRRVDECCRCDVAQRAG